ncbi:hypothetical protein [Streptomyces chumphonensis]|uniref:hypothetical protein n=1 Tax=Streptomyces chumphonensis TaxID=1214925 RepID=UPI003D734333
MERHGIASELPLRASVRPWCATGDAVERRKRTGRAAIAERWGAGPSPRGRRAG